MISNLFVIELADYLRPYAIITIFIYVHDLQNKIKETNGFLYSFINLRLFNTTSSP